MPTNNKHSILYVDDEENNLVVFKAAFRNYYNIFTCTSAKEGMKILKENTIALIVTDQRMPQMTGVQFLEAVIPDYPDTIRMILTGFSDIEAIINAINTGRVYRYITKPWDEADMKMTMDKALEAYQLQQRNKELLQQLQDKMQEQERTLRIFQKFIPQHVLRETLHAQTDDSLLRGESRIISVLISDIRNSTAMASNMDPREVVAMLNNYLTLMTESIKRHNGSVNKFIGDGILATFGAPVSYIDNQGNAVLCALDMLEKLSEFNRSYASKLGRQLTIGIGINTGEVIAGNIGSEERMEYAVIGDTVNIASRIESLTVDTPNGIFISRSTYGPVEELIEAKKLDDVYVKGKACALEIYQVLGKKNHAL
jgi:adenylate cyclase